MPEGTSKRRSRPKRARRTVLVLRAGTGATNNLIRSLKAGDRSLVVVGCHHDVFSLRKSTADRNYLVCRPDERGFASSLRRVVAMARVDLVIPNTDEDVKTISRLRHELPCHVFLPADRVIDLCQDKYSLTCRLASRGVPVPATVPVESLATVEEAFEKLALHSIVWCRIRKGAGSVAATPVRTSEHARGWIRYWQEMRGVPHDAFTLSEYLPGRDYACQSLWMDGSLVLIKTTERLSYFGGGHTPSGVSSVGGVHKTVREPRVAEVSAAAVRAVDPDASGAFSVDLKENTDGEPCVTEINVGRMLSGTPIFDLAGKHNMALTHVRLALGERVDIADPYDATEGYYMARDLDTPAEIFRGVDVFEGIEDARG